MFFLSSSPFEQCSWWEWNTHWPCPPKGISGHPYQLLPHTPWPQGNHFMSLGSSSLLAKHILVNWELPLNLGHSWENQVWAQSITSGAAFRNYYKWQKYREWEYIWQNMNNCMNIHYKNMTPWGFLNIFLRHHITWGVVFEWVMVITDCCKLKHCVICSLAAQCCQKENSHWMYGRQDSNITGEGSQVIDLHLELKSKLHG